jgi:hypothetical protein
MTDEPECLRAGLAYIARGWPAFPVKPQAKEPLTKHGVKDATLDGDQLRRWFHRWPTANIAIACGSPGPQVLDIDDLAAGHDTLVVVSRLGGPDVATARGRQFYLRGSTQGTIALGWGELRGRGSYVVAPPSTHPTGKLYVYLIEPGDAPLPGLPSGILPANASTAGTGNFDAPELIGFGQRHDALKDATVRFVRAGFVDPHTLEQMLIAFFTSRCDPNPPPRPNEFKQLAAWGAKTAMATRERMLADVEDEPKPKGKRPKAPTGLEVPPRGDAPLKEHRAYVGVAGGWGDRIDIEAVVRYGQRPSDALEMKLSNGQIIHFDRQEHVATRGGWARLVTLCTNGIANPVALSEVEGQKVLRSLCILSDAPTIIREVEELVDAVESFVVRCEEIAHDLSTPDGRFDAIDHCRRRTQWDPFHDDDERRPALLQDLAANGARYMRAGELRAWLNHEGFKIDASALAGRMLMIGVQHTRLAGREARRPGQAGARATNHGVFYRLPDEAVEE